MFSKVASFEKRLGKWAKFRTSLESSVDPIQAAIDQYNQAPMVSIHTDPYDRSTWPTPWELVKENQYCDFCKLLGICYSLQLTDSFSNERFEIHIQRSDKNSQIYYLLFVGNRVVGYDKDTHVAISELPADLELQHRYTVSV